MKFSPAGFINTSKDMCITGKGVSIAWLLMIQRSHEKSITESISGINM